MNSYILTRRWFDFAFENPEKVTIAQTALFMWLIELNNRKGWVLNYQFNTSDACGAIGARDSKTVWKALNELNSFGFVEIVYKSTHRHKASIVSIQNCNVDTLGCLDATLSYQSEKSISKESVNVPVTEQLAVQLPRSNSEVNGLLNGASIKPLNNETNKLLVVEALSERELEIENAIQGYCQTPTEEEKEKSAAQKEKAYPTLEEAEGKVSQTAHWRNAKDHHQLTDERRQSLFKIFYEMKEDNYRIRYPSTTDMASNFYFWIKTYQARETIQNIKENAITNTQTKHASSTKFGRGGQAEKRDGLRALKNKSADFLRQTGY